MRQIPGKTEKEVLDTINHVVNILSPTFVFGYYDIDDIKQHGRMEAIKCLERYDESRPLAPFLYSHIFNRLKNLRRDEYCRADCPCLECKEGNYCTGTNEPCSVFAEWQKRNADKASLAKPVGIDTIGESYHIDDKSEFINGVEKKEIFEIIDEKLPFEYRETYLKMKAGVTVPKQKRLEVEAKLREIFNV